MNWLLWLWILCGPAAWYLTGLHVAPFDPLRAWLMIGWLGRWLSQRGKRSEFFPISWRWLAIHACMLGILLSLDTNIFSYIEQRGLFFMPNRLAVMLFPLGDGFTDVGLLLLLALAGRRVVARDGLWGAFNACVNVQILKTLFGRAFPNCGAVLAGEFRGPLGLPWHEAFPSGHTTSAMAVATVLAHHYPRYRWPFYILGGLVGVSTVVIRVHWLGDAYAGMVLGYISGQEAIHNQPNLLCINRDTTLTTRGAASDTMRPAQV